MRAGRKTGEKAGGSRLHSRKGLSTFSHDTICCRRLTDNASAGAKYVFQLCLVLLLSRPLLASAEAAVSRGARPWSYLSRRFQDRQPAFPARETRGISVELLRESGDSSFFSPRRGKSFDRDEEAARGPRDLVPVLVFRGSSFCGFARWLGDNVLEMLGNGRIHYLRSNSAGKSRSFFAMKCRWISVSWLTPCFAFGN